MKENLDILVICAHPDDAELGAAGSLFLASQKGARTGILNLTRGELGSNGTPEIRRKEAKKAAELIGLQFLEILDLGDGTFEISKQNLDVLIGYLRRLRPQILITNALEDRHPDHSRAARLVKQAAFYSGLRRWKIGNSSSEAFRPTILLHLIQDFYQRPSFVTDITEVYARRMEIVHSYASQFFKEATEDFVETPISRSDFQDFLEARSRELGRLIGVTFGEGFVCERPLGIADMKLLTKWFG